MRVTCIVCYPFWRWSRDRPAEFADVGWRARAKDLANAVRSAVCISDGLQFSADNLGPRGIAFRHSLHN